MFLIETTKEDLKMAEAELSAFTKVTKQKNYFLAEKLPKSSWPRFTLVNRIFQETKIPSKPSTFKFETIGVKESKIVDKMRNKGWKVNLNKPKYTFSIIKGKLYKLVYTNKKDYLKRDPKFRPGFHPAACSAKLARLMVNLSGAKKILDPFCGTGGILIEAGDMNIKSEGSDMEKSMVEKTKKNLKYYKVKSKVSQANAFETKGKYGAIVTELPFGKATKMDSSINKLFSDFLNHAKKLTKVVVIVVPDKKYNIKGWKTEFTRKIYIHKSLSKRIYFLRLL